MSGTYPDVFSADPFCMVDMTAEFERRERQAEIAASWDRAFMMAAQGWTTDQFYRRGIVEAGACVIANMSRVKGAQKDGALISWAIENGLFQRIDRTTKWGNPFSIPADGNRTQVCQKFAEFYLPHKKRLLSSFHELRGKVLGCWCHPKQCHGHTLVIRVNAEADLEARAAEIAGQSS